MEIIQQLLRTGPGTRSDQTSLTYHAKLEQIEKRVKNTHRPKLLGRRGRNDLYNMSSPCRGWCLIYSNASFKSKNLSRLDGHIRDAFTLKRIFGELMFKPVVINNWDISRLKYTAKKYANSIPRRCNNPAPDAIAVIILTHGDEKNKILGRSYVSTEATPEEVIDVSEFQEIFNNENCPLLQGKPKLFFVQACRGAKSDNGVPEVQLQELAVLREDDLSQDADDQNDEAERGNTSSDVATAANTKLDEASCSVEGVIPTVTDIFTCHATAVGYTSFVHPSGSVFGVSLAWHLVHHAHDMELLKLIKKISRDINKESTETGPTKRYKQSVNFGCQGWTKEFYFNPGYPKLEPNQVNRKRKAVLPKTIIKTKTTPPPPSPLTNVGNNNDSGFELGVDNDEVNSPTRKRKMTPIRKKAKRKKFPFPPPKNQPTIDSFFSKTVNEDTIRIKSPLQPSNGDRKRENTRKINNHFNQFKKVPSTQIQTNYCSCVMCDTSLQGRNNLLTN